MSEESTESTVSDEQIVADSISRPENVPEKFWDAESKTTRHDDVLKSYNELSGRFGAFTGAPDSYEFAVSEQLKEAGVELDMESPMITSFIEMAKAGNMSQEMASNVVNMYLESQHADGLAMGESETTRQAEEMAKLGDTALQRITNIESWAKANMPDNADGLIDAATTAEGVMAIEKLIAKTRNSSMNGDETALEANLVTEEEVNKLQFETDDYGNRRMSSDPAFAKMVRAKMAQLHPGDHQITVG